MRDPLHAIDTSQEAVAARLNLVMEAFDDSPTRFASRIGVTPQVVANWRASQFVSREGAVAILRTYGVSIDWLLVGLEHKLEGDARIKIQEARAKRLKRSA
ncbi:helix-turn-helix domain-containing protein [uncultured Methylobacterium sp.]|uniref:helix-turn-helix domain-containing protein n=1 Tax=uncultured Methylobacterium sp. TaxID=157278 RepID=UPI0035CAA611